MDNDITKFWQWLKTYQLQTVHDLNRASHARWRDGNNESDVNYYLLEGEDEALTTVADEFYRIFKTHLNKSKDKE